jgi:glycosyltransferase involved in cell wall biosynthesis
MLQDLLGRRQAKKVGNLSTKSMKKVSSKKVTVVIPTYKPIRTISKCLQSIDKQSYNNIEIIVVDSSPYDKKLLTKLKSLVKKFGTFVTDGPERSIQRNRGIFDAKGEYILTIDQDMYLTKDVIKDCVSMMERGKYIALVIPEISIGRGYWSNCVALERYVSTYLEEGMNECCRFFRKKDAIKIKGYDPAIVGVEDSDFHYRLSEKGKMGKTTEYIYHDEGTTRYWDRIRKKYYYSKAFKKYLERRPGIAVKQFFPIKKAYFKHWMYFARKPHLAIGVILLRGGEVAAGAIGMLHKD